MLKRDRFHFSVLVVKIILADFAGQEITLAGLSIQIYS